MIPWVYQAELGLFYVSVKSAPDIHCQIRLLHDKGLGARAQMQGSNCGRQGMLIHFILGIIMTMGI